MSRKTFFLKLKKNIFLWLGVFLFILSITLYSRNGYSNLILVLWIISLLITGAYFFKSRGQIQKRQIKFFNQKDFFLFFILFLIFSPLYLSSLYTVPWQVNTDEITIMLFAKKYAAAQTPDILGASDYFGFPTFIFFLFGRLSQFLGGVNLLNFRIVHAVSGLLIILLSYFLFKVATESRLMAFGGAAILGANHALLALSRMAMRDNTGLLFEVASLTLLLLGSKRKSPFYSFLGGAAAGLTFYSYYPARVTIFVWLLTLGLVAIFLRKEISFGKIFKLGTLNLLGLIMVAAPIIISGFKNPGSLNYQREQFLIFSEGQKLEQEWTGTTNAKDAVLKNIKNGLTAFNNKINDQGYIYPNYNHSFVDPITGTLIWLGLITLVFKKGKKEADILALVGFTSLWLLLSFIITKAPHYQRLLITLPFVAYLTVYGLKIIALALSALFKKLKINLAKIAYRIPIITGVMAIIISNVVIFGDFVKKGLAEGNDVGSTARYVEARKDIPNYTFYLAVSKDYPYYGWGDEYQWQSWLGYFIQKNQSLKIISPDNLVLDSYTFPFTVFMNASVWSRWDDDLKSKYSNIKIHNIKTDGSLLAAEINSS